MSLQDQRVQEDSTAAPFCIMTGTVREPVDLQNPPPSPIRDLVTTPVENPSTDFTSQLTKQLTHEISSRKSAYGLACALAESAVRNGHTFVAEENYEDYTAQSPFHQAENCRTAAWVVLYRGTLGRPPFRGRDMIGPGSKICLFDTALALRYTGFEQPTLYAELGRPIYRENGYHFFGLTPHLCVVTGSFIPICLDCVISLIAIPDALIYPAFKLNIPACMDTIGQQVKAGGHYVYPPLHEWEKDPGWRHPEWYKIEQWMRGERPELPGLWAEFLERA